MNKRYIDVFNGDADGLCALIQLRKATPHLSERVTGIKRDINLLKKVQAEEGDHITVLDISFEKNSEDITRLLEQGASIDYFDHHKTGTLVKHNKLTCHIDLSAETCTSLIVDKVLQGQYREWAIVGAFGDNLSTVARQLGQQSEISDADIDLLQQIGIYLNYNGYGMTMDDLFFNPLELFEKLYKLDSPLELVKHDNNIFTTLEKGYEHDMQKAKHIPLKYQTDTVAIIEFPNEQWARRVSGVYSNDLTNRYPDRAHACMTEKDNGHYLVSVRAPLNRRTGADTVVSQFPTGGGRKAAAGINDLSWENVDPFIQAMAVQFAVN